MTVMRLYLKIWRQKNSDTPGQLVDYQVDGIIPQLSFLERLDVLNEKLLKPGDEPVEPWRSSTFPIIKDSMVDRSALDRIIAAGGYISVNTGSAPDANTILIAKAVAKEGFGAGSNTGACSFECPKNIPLSHIARLNREYLAAQLF